MSYDTSYLYNDNIYTREYFENDDVCRLCWTRNAVKEILPKISNFGEDIKNNVLAKINFCLNLTSVDVKNGPNKVCDNCLINVETFYSFKLFCNESDKKLQQILSKEFIETPVLPESLMKVKLEKNERKTKSESIDDFLETLYPSDCDVQSDSSYNDDRQLNIRATLRKTKTTRPRKKPYKVKRTSSYCNICRTDYENEEKFSMHNEKFHGIQTDGLYKCFGCERRFQSRKTRLGHEIKFCKGLKNGYECSVCNRYLPKRGMYESHMRDHRLNKPIDLPEDIFKCKNCKKKFKTREELKTHYKVHDDGKKHFVCELCGRVFTRMDYLNKHMLVHMGLKQHVCPHCGYRATQKSSLNIHLRKHTGEKPFSCDLCPQKCVTSSNLRAHRRRHSGLKKYECSLCSKKFGYKTSLEEHIAVTHERTQNYCCHICGTSYARFGGLRRHIRTKHDKKEKNDTEDVKIDDTREERVPNSNIHMEAETTYLKSQIEHDGDEFLKAEVMLERNDSNLSTGKVENDLLLKELPSYVLKEGEVETFLIKTVDIHENVFVV